MKKTESKLYFEMTIFFFIVVLCFGLLIIKEKSESFKKDKVNKKIDEYIDTNYKDIKNEFKKSKLKYKNNTYTVKISNTENKNLYFSISYKNNKINSTYKKDYLEGKSLFSFLEKNMNYKLKKLNNDNYYKDLKVTYDLTLDNCTPAIKNKLIKGNYDLSLYTINDKRSISLNKDTLQTELLKLHNYILSLNLNPKEYNVTYTDINNETKSINIIINEETLKNNIDAGRIIIENDEKNLNLNNIKVKYLN